MTGTGGCGVTTGFFVLRRCGGLVATGCRRCGRPICAAHVADGGLCPECAAATAGPAARSGGAALAHHRRSFYSSSSRDYHDPVWYGSFDSYDRAAFQPDNAGHGHHPGHHPGHHHGHGSGDGRSDWDDDSGSLVDS